MDGGRGAAMAAAAMEGRGSCEIMREGRRRVCISIIGARSLFCHQRIAFSKHLLITAIDFIFSTCHTSMT